MKKFVNIICIFIVSLLLTQSLCFADDEIEFGTPTPIQPRTGIAQDDAALYGNDLYDVLEGELKDLDSDIKADIDNIDKDKLATIMDMKGLDKILSSSLIEKLKGEIRQGKVSEETLEEVKKEINKNATSDKLIEIFDENEDELKKLGLNNADLKGLRKLLSTNSIIVGDVLNSSLDAIADLANGESIDTVMANILDSNLTNIIIGAIVIFFAVFIGIVILVLVISYVLTSIGYWGIFKKAGQKPWKGLIPFYRNVIYLKVCKFNPWVYAISFIPFVGPSIYSVIKLMSYFRLSELFGHELLVSVIMAFFPGITQIVLGFNKDKYLGNDSDEKSNNVENDQDNFNSADFK